MKLPILLDTSSIVHVLDNRADADILIDRPLVFISAITVMELLALSGMGQDEQETIDALLAGFIIKPVDEAVARRAGALVRTRPNRRHRIDLVIAATALELGAPLYTSNPRDFARIPMLKVVATR